ncbi:hypothetical protein DFJ58DRAFT_730186 [Suillus subalutaceus]|uniref:uncharacterized protein n=1 Tax=Suillus subalutaceus TaxID=48586 RepID=UPI001B86ADE8|nr:uncharacterized protein DFJ58DRAFT_730186 [Suillus subalutaceus]KAG1847307.1 hypothetical protein DFJ58DRAFT_730186 [Suillus subalutaceus]
MSTLQGTQPDAFLWIKYGYVALSSLWVYEYVLCIADSVTYLIESPWRLGMLTIFQPDASNALCRSYEEANLYWASDTSLDIGFLTIFFAECIFVLRALAVYHRDRKWVVFMTIFVIVHLVPMIVCFYKFASLLSGECSIPGFIRYVDTKEKILVLVMYILLASGELGILLFLLHRTVDFRSSGWKIDNRLKRGLLHHNLLYFGWSCAFFAGLGLTSRISSIPAAHIVAQFVYSQFGCDEDYLFGSRYHVVVQALLVTRMHRDFWRSDRAFCGISGEDVSFATFMVAIPDIV